MTAAADRLPAAEGAGALHTTTTTTVRTRSWVRRDHVVTPFVWQGLLPLLGLLGLLWYGLGPFSHWIESRVKQNVQTALADAGHGWAQMTVSGQNVLLTGTPPAAGAGDAALEVARAARCPTWTGPRVCAVEVLGQFGDSAAPAPAAAPPAPAPTAEQHAAAAKCEISLAALLAGKRIEFDTASARLLPTSAPLLDQLARTAGECPGYVQVQGFTDSVGQPEANLELSRARAQAVVHALRERGVPADRLSSVGFGEDKPIADNATADGRALNRRIEFRVSATR